MDRIGTPSAGSPEARNARALLSPQVSEARTFFLNLGGGRTEPIVLVLGGRERCNPDYALVRSRFPYFVIEYVVSGRGWVTLDGIKHALGPGDVVAYAPTTKVELRTDPAEPMSKYFLALSGSGVAARLRRCGIPAGCARPLAVSAEATSVIEDLVREALHSGRFARPLAAALLEVLLLKFEEAASRGPRASEPARAAFLRCKALIDAHAETLGSLAEIAAAAKVEASSVCRWFRTYQGTSPYQYLLRRKMTLAAEFLMESGGLVKEAASRVGFADPYHFSRCFKAVHGAPPSQLSGLRR